MNYTINENLLINTLFFWDKLNIDHKNLILNNSYIHAFKAQELVKNGSATCEGIYIILDGRMRAYILSPEGKELTMFRLLENDFCIFTASCAMKDINFDIFIESETATNALVIPTSVFQVLSENSLEFSNYINSVMASRLSDVMWLIEQIMFKSLDKRLAGFLIDESLLTNSTTLYITHEKIANHLGTAREVITRMLKYFQAEQLIELKRGKVIIKDLNALNVYVN